MRHLVDVLAAAIERARGGGLDHALVKTAAALQPSAIAGNVASSYLRVSRDPASYAEENERVGTIISTAVAGALLGVDDALTAAITVRGGHVDLASVGRAALVGAAKGALLVAMPVFLPWFMPAFSAYQALLGQGLGRPADDTFHRLSSVARGHRVHDLNNEAETT